MTAGALLSVLMALAVLAFVLTPLLRRNALDPGDTPGSSIDRLRELHAEQQMLLTSLKDLEDDRAMDKVGEADYATLNNRLTTRAIEVMQRLDAAQSEHDRELAEASRASRPLRYPGGGRAGSS